MKATEQKVIRFIYENKLINSKDKVLIALSGGPDSVFLLHFFNKFRKKYKIEIGAVHINHLLRGKNSDRDELFCKTICEELLIPFYKLKKNVSSFSKMNKISIEIAGRKIRYEYFNKISKLYNYNKIATAHNADDNTETVLLNLIKGAGLKGIAGIPVNRNNIIRPILCLTKKEILEYLDANRFEFRIDESNLTNEYERNFIRNEVIPLLTNNINSSISKTILNTSLNLQSLDSKLFNLTDKIRSEIVVAKNKMVTFPESIFNDKDEFLISYTLKEIIDVCFSVKTESKDFKKLFNLVKKQSGKSEELTGNLIALKERDKIFIRKFLPSNKSSILKIKVGESINIGKNTFSVLECSKDLIKIKKAKNEEFISADKVSGTFTIRTWKNGDRFFPIGMQGSKKISDYLNDIKTNSFEKKEQLVLVNNERIVWVIGKRLDERFKITSNTKKVVKLCLK